MESRDDVPVAILLYAAVLPYCAVVCKEANARIWATCRSLPAAGNLFGTSMLCVQQRECPASSTETRPSAPKYKQRVLNERNKKRKGCEMKSVEAMFLVAF